MTRNAVLYSVRIGMVTALFGAGFLCGSLSQHDANAQFGTLGDEMLKKATKSGGLVGSVAQLGTTITDLEKHVSGLQKNLETLRSVKAALSGIPR